MGHILLDCTSSLCLGPACVPSLRGGQEELPSFPLGNISRAQHSICPIQPATSYKMPQGAFLDSDVYNSTYLSFFSAVSRRLFGKCPLRSWGFLGWEELEVIEESAGSVRSHFPETWIATKERSSTQDWQWWKGQTLSRAETEQKSPGSPCLKETVQNFRIKCHLEQHLGGNRFGS